ncbi:iron-sulfur cluster biosynthesis family protein [Cytobacillus sp. FJAT-54145]|uniref:Iron-sulfur cluster biosynthesis family protein n=1 Tax=Cytobacillus spartinae TaxID=3299023 RepID=A0ABW6KFR9_9BACI
MNITLTEVAGKKIQEKIQNQQGFLKLKYDTEGCGCVVSGVTSLWFVNELDEDDREIQTNMVPVYVEKSKEVFLDDELKIDFSASSNCFQLKSPNQYLNPRMSFIDKTVE